MNLNLKISEVESIKLQLDLLINYTPKGTVLNKKQLLYLSYFAIYGFKKGKELILEKEISLNGQVWSNHLNLFRDLGLVVGVRENSKLNPNIKLNFSEFTYTLNIKFDESRK